MTSTDAMTARRLIAYFRDCMLADGGEREIRDVFGRDESDHFLFAFDPGKWDPSRPVRISRTEADKIASRLRLQQQEKELIAGMYLVRARVTSGARGRRNIRAPLLLFNAELSREGFKHVVRIDPETVRINPVVVEALGLSPSDDDVDVARAHRWLEGIDRREHVGSKSKLPRWRSGQAPFWMPTGLVWVTGRSALARTVAYELDDLTNHDSDLSRPLRQILGGTVEPADKMKAPVPETLPTRLTSAQERTLRNAAGQTLSVVNGPPGTGKTYVIACQAIDRVMRGERVLVVCGNEHAADVVRDKLGVLFGKAEGLLVRAGRGDYQRELLQRLDELLSQTGPEAAELPYALERKLDETAKRYRAEENRFREALDESVRHGGFWHGENSTGLLSLLRRWWIRRKLSKRPMLSECWSALQERVATHQELAGDYLHSLSRHNIQGLLRHKRRQLAALATALRSRASGRRQERFERLDWDVLTEAFPVWVVSAQALHRVLPRRSELFHLVIIDEATQCNLPLALPALQRAARAVVVGDPKQLRHFSFLSREKQRRLAARHELDSSMLDLDYRERSLLDYAIDAVAGPHAMAFLDEHFRSHPDLISFSNERFYKGRLKILTHLKEAADEFPVEVVECPVDIADDVNHGEVESVLTRLRTLVEQNADVPEHECPQIGVLTFFQATAVILERRLLEEFDLATVSRHDIRVGTPYAFQGEERDIMLLATGVYPGRSHAAWNYINRSEVFNVAVTRARHRQILFLTVGALDSVRSSLLGDYLEHARRPRNRGTARAAAGEQSMRSELLTVLQQSGVHCRLDFPFAGQTVDLLARHRGHAVAVDAVGCGTAAGQAWEWERYRLLERAGLSLFPVSYVEWREHRNRVLERLRNALGAVSFNGEPESTRRYRALRWRIEELRDTELLALLDALEQAYTKSLHWLQLRFKDTELAYLRYRQGIERLHHAAFAELQGATLLMEGFRDLDPEAVDGPLRKDLRGRVDQAREATEALDALTERLAILRTSDTGLQDALTEIDELAGRLSRYGLAETGSESLFEPFVTSRSTQSSAREPA